MKISELIKRLNDIKDINGDLEILHLTEDNEGFLVYETLENIHIKIIQDEKNIYVKFEGY